jgi:hypothetical protein
MKAMPASMPFIRSTSKQEENPREVFMSCAPVNYVKFRLEH